MRPMLCAAVGAVSLLAAAGCSHDKKNDRGDERAAPSAAAVIPGTFHNTVDEAGFRKKLPATADLLQQSTSGFALHNPAAGGQTSLAHSLLRGAAQRLQLPATAVQALTGALAAHGVPAHGPGSGGAPTGGAGGDPSSSLDQVQALQAGSDCTQLATSLTGSFDQALQSYTKTVNTLASEDFSTAKGFSRVTPDSAQEAFAYKITLTNADLQQSGLTDASSDGQMGFDGRFAGGADDHAVALKANGTLSMSAQDVSGNILTDLDTYADVAAKQLSTGLGFDLAFTGKNDQGQPAAVGARFSYSMQLAGGDKPSETMHVTGSATNGKETRAEDVSVSLTKSDAKTLALTVSGKVDAKTFNETVTMALAKDEFGYDTCKVTGVAR